ncbi:Uncharacterized protein dnm_085510 [Desulfonema magnum]|uniref:Uncharacterized protein n=1 Tax=Desulfonema magnum TaxID=45655 RepID=A0A975GSW6_9BACT|nr:Uncharacterized protein dnm_085510 [Desulfonema magnum]
MAGRVPQREDLKLSDYKGFWEVCPRPELVEGDTPPYASG